MNEMCGLESAWLRGKGTDLSVTDLKVMGLKCDDE